MQRDLARRNVRTRIEAKTSGSNTASAGLARERTAELAEHLRTAVGDLVRAARRQDALPPAHAAVLDLLDREGAMTTADLAQRRRVRHQSMAATVSQLLEIDLISRSDDRADARKKIISLTPAGARAIAADRRSRGGRLAAVIARTLSDAEAESLEDALHLLERIAHELRADQEPSGSMLTDHW
jgi:DNA-binding MarR family transcriptional regulator